MKPHVKFGLSPFGIWRPNNPPSIKGFDQYEELYADAKLWLNNGWVDYFSPQLYWTINNVEQSFPVLLSWWESENLKRRHLWVGSDISEGSDEVINQIMITRGMLSESPGIIHWSIAPLVNDSAFAKNLQEGPYSKKVLVPQSPWLWNEKPDSPNLDFELEDENLIISPEINKEYKSHLWILYYCYGDTWEYMICPSSQKHHVLPQMKHSDDTKEKKKITTVGISVVDRFGNESEINFFDLVNRK